VSAAFNIAVLLYEFRTMQKKIRGLARAERTPVGCGGNSLVFLPEGPLPKILPVRKLHHKLNNQKRIIQ
jgi:hypothetical protein